MFVCPTVTANDMHEYRAQVERVQGFATRIHFDFMDGVFAPTKSPALSHAWWPPNVKVDLHVMYKYPLDETDTILHLKPQLVIVHAEAEGNFVQFARELHAHKISVGIALLQDTEPEVIRPALKVIDHVLIFSGKLGYHGGVADMSQLSKIQLLRRWKKTLEIGWDGGVTPENAKLLIDGGVDVLNVGGSIQKNDDPGGVYATLKSIITSTGK